MKRNFIHLIKKVDEKTGEILEKETFVTPAFIPFTLVYEATDVMSGLEDKSEKESMDIMLDTIVKIYNNQFDAKQLSEGLHAPEAVETLQKQIEFVASGAMDDKRKKELAKLI
ncbi:hypothetical protein RM577_03540 [Mammaliicoccus sciuri]|uniref:phage tail assembly chaperone G n=1 Tax=Mammaliicoccus sciuri TaxID=1296 RepID=UPI0028874C1F|nr:hypothetical protein [Mammaliicoccus sciuri]MDT0707362.1 hypothetical protein [Mammaliicoccus sciuri]